ncbi:hypothetical protein SEA_EYRE_56 [Gordonia phage Eyre]|uniref:Helix-turn-helix DNA binding domain protein n=1 Tax=Gordonia phage Eyre TaxID=1887646 RepID=A0A1B3B041_9CAUD|nr:hypothetical protein BIZ73_gp56 [Gordonia phage Eyre]AOE44336.1 hypothetical protein SEA_EYRE_56 [Gordonia phage Eyre]
MSTNYYNTDKARSAAKRQLRAGELADAGMTIAEIARALGAGRKTISRDLDAMGIEPRPGKPGPKRKGADHGESDG